MKKILLLAAMSVALNATPLTVYNTGVDAAHAVLAAGSTDPHYTNSTAPVLVEGTINAAWLPNTATSKWVGPDAGDGSGLSSGNYSLTYRTTVDLTGFSAASAAITGRWATDNTGVDILLNGVSKGLTSSGFGAYSNFALSSGFVSGVNTIDFSWANSGGPGGLRVEFLTANANLNSQTPEPASIALMLSGVAALAFFRRK